MSARARRSAFAIAVCVLGCHAPDDALPPSTVRVATSASLEDAGLFDALAPVFEGQTGQALQPSFVGTGRALEMGRTGNADVVWVHSRIDEDTFVSEGHGINRRDVMYSEYVIVGPPEDPAKIDGLSSAVPALERIYTTNSRFVSRADKSGNHTRELELWELAGVELGGPWYETLNAGMLSTLLEASKRKAYALTDLPTYQANAGRLESRVLVRGDARLQNRYGIIAVNPIRVSDANYSGAMAFIDFLASPTARSIVADFGRDRSGTSLFVPSGEAASAP
jgi:tungstate transport system substrate-binding protein